MGSAAATTLAAPAFAESIDSAAKKLAATSYPFLSEIDWSSPIYSSLPGVSSKQLLSAVDKALLMGAAMDGKLLSEAVTAHHKAIGAMNAKGVTSQSAYAELLSTLGSAIASAPEETVLDTFNAYKALIGNPEGFPNAFKYLKATVNPADAYAAAGGFLEFTDAVKRA